MIDGQGISGEIALRWMPLDLTDDKSTLIKVMAWCHQTTSHYLSQCWSRSMSTFGVTKPQWGKDSFSKQLYLSCEVNWVVSIAVPVLKLEYSWRTRSMQWLLMPWLLVSPGHQYQRYWLCRIKWGFQRHSRSQCWKMQTQFYVTRNKFRTTMVEVLQLQTGHKGCVCY